MTRFKFKVTRIIDADTICGKIDLPFGIEVERTVRVAGIDCPEIRRCSEVEKQLGLEALGYVSQWLRFAEDNVYLQSSQNSWTGRTRSVASSRTWSTADWILEIRFAARDWP